jgi:acyl-CoA thioesterase-1
MLNATIRNLKISSDSTILFQGDSITDCGRNRKSGDSLGQGYVMMISSWYSAKYPEMNVKFINRGRSGDRVRELKARWRTDCLNLKPAVVSILVGVNDILRTNIWNRSTSIESFEGDYRFLLQQIRDEIHAEVILMQPFLLENVCGYVGLRKEHAKQIKVIKDLSKEFGAVLIPLDAIFQKACKKQPSRFWTEDGVHPTLTGHALIAQSWLETVDS